MFSTLQEAYFRTKYPIAREVFASIWPTNALWAFLRMRPLVSTSAFNYFRRKKGDEIQGKWIIPGMAISPDANPKLVRMMCELRNIISQQELPDYFVANVDNPDAVWGSNMVQASIDLGRQVAKAAVVGKYIDTCNIVSGGSLTSATLLGAGVITPGPYNIPTLGFGNLRYNKAANTLQFKAPGDNDYGDAVVASGTITLYSKYVGSYVTLTVAGVPASDAGCELIFSSTTQQPDGLDALIDPDQRIASSTNGQSLTFTLMNKMITKLAEPYQNDPLTCYVMHSDQVNVLYDLANALGGTRLDTMEYPILDPTLPGNVPGSTIKRMIPVYRGHPILACDHIPATVKGTSPVTRSIYLTSLNPDLTDGQNIPVDGENPPGGFFGVVGGRMDGPMMNGPYGMGFFVKRITPDSRTTEAQRMGYYGNFGLGSALAACAADNVISPQ